MSAKSINTVERTVPFIIFFVLYLFIFIELLFSDG